MLSRDIVTTATTGAAMRSWAPKAGRRMRWARPRPRTVELRPLVGSTAAQSRPVAPHRRTVPAQHSSSPAARRCRFLAASGCTHVDCTRPGVTRQLVDRAITSKPPELADGRSVHPPGMDAPARPVARPEHITAVLVRTIAVLVRFSLDTSYSQACRHAGTRAATSRGSETC